MPENNKDILDRVKTRLSILDGSKDTILEDIIQSVTDNIAIRAGVLSFPAILNSIAVDVCIAYYNRLGSEGLQSESIDVISSNFIIDLLEPYDKQIDEFKKGLSENDMPSKGVVFF
ncbi:phage head-tail connector protein [Listeria monocytogenes]|uniref:phage head-tail connector protein n=1 Tax=Listeria monocytogenes TaxID=1639 RepID=UPI0034A5B7D0